MRFSLFYFCWFLPMVVAAQSPKPSSTNDRLQVFEQRKQLLANSVLNGTAFTNIGPSVMSGRVVDIDVNPTNPTEFYVAYATGGLWHTTNNGQSFVPIFDSADILFIGDIAVNWWHTKRIIWVGTGEVNSSRSSYAGMGIYKTEDNGKNWEWLGLPETHHIGKLQLHPTNHQIVWVAALGHLYSSNKERGVFKTTNGGKTWKHTLFIDDYTGIVDLDINPNNPNELFAAAWYRTRSAWNFEEAGKTSGIYKSTDGGETWKKITTPGSGFLSNDGVGRIGLAVYPANPSIVFAIVDNQNRYPDTAKQKVDTVRYSLRDFKDLNKEQFLALNNKKFDSFLVRTSIPRKYKAAGIKELVQQNKLKPSCIWDFLYDANTALFETPIIGAEIYKSEDGGNSWKKMNEKAIPELYNTYGYYFGKIYVSAANVNKVIITGVPVMMSLDGGKTFKSIDRENVHSDHHAIWINPQRDEHIINGNDGGLNITYDDGKHWFKANTPAVAQFYAIAVDMAKPYNVYGGLQDNGTWYAASTTKENYDWYDNGKNPYSMLNGGDGMQVQVDWRDNTTVYTGYQFGNYTRINVQRPGERKNITPRRDLGEPAYRFNWQTPILISRHNQDIVYYGSNKLHRSFNRGDSLPPISEDLTTAPPQGDVPFGTITTISESPLKFGLLYAGTDDGNIQISKDGGYTWKLISSNLPKGLWVSRVIASQYNEARVYASLNGYRNDHFLPYVFVSDDYGNSWNPIGTDLPNEPVNVVKEDSKYPNIIYVGTDGGLYVSTNTGKSFMMWNAGLPASVPIHDLIIHPRDHEIILGTHGRSLYVAKLEKLHQWVGAKKE
jgi:photosystem II stability/assembly factor-like uncharacterized protein